MEDDTPEGNGHFKTIVAVLIALVSMLSAVVAWRIALASDTASTADFTGLTAALHAEDTRASNQAAMYAHYRAYTDYVRYFWLVQLIEAELESSPPEAQPLLRRQMDEAGALALNAGYFFPGRYLSSDTGQSSAGGLTELKYDKERELGEAWADAARRLDIEPEPHFALSDRARLNTIWLVAVVIMLSLSLWFYSLAQTLSHAIKYALVAIGSAFLLAGAGAVVIIEWWQ